LSFSEMFDFFLQQKWLYPPLNVKLDECMYRCKIVVHIWWNLTSIFTLRTWWGSTSGDIGQILPFGCFLMLSVINVRYHGCITKASLGYDQSGAPSTKNRSHHRPSRKRNWFQCKCILCCIIPLIWCQIQQDAFTESHGWIK
jgi:hypothetical protein